MQKILISLAVLALGACSAHRVDIQQGNVITQEQLAKLEKGMERGQVRFLLGTPLLRDPFHADRWDYYYSYHPGDGERESYRVTVYFDGPALARVESHGPVPETAEETVQAGQRMRPDF